MQKAVREMYRAWKDWESEEARTAYYRGMKDLADCLRGEAKRQANNLLAGVRYLDEIGECFTT